jgi:hypothetical protein
MLKWTAGFRPRLPRVLPAVRLAIGQRA